MKNNKILKILICIIILIIVFVSGYFCINKLTETQQDDSEYQQFKSRLIANEASEDGYVYSEGVGIKIENPKIEGNTFTYDIYYKVDSEITKNHDIKFLYNYRLFMDKTKNKIFFMDLSMADTMNFDINFYLGNKKEASNLSELKISKYKFNETLDVDKEAGIIKVAKSYVFNDDISNIDQLELRINQLEMRDTLETIAPLIICKNSEWQFTLNIQK